MGGTDGNGESETGTGESNALDLSETAGGLQERLTAHGRKLAEAAGDRAEEAGTDLAAAIGQFGHPGEGETAGAEGLAFDEPARLPWLESADDDYEDDGAVDTRRVMLVVAAGLALLAAIVGGIWWSTHRGGSDERAADGSLIAAPSTPYKTAPTTPGGKTYEGTGASSFAVSQGHNPGAHLAGDGTADAAVNASPTPGASPVHTAAQAGAVAVAAANAAHAGEHPTAAPAPAADHGGVGVQVGAYTSQAGAEAGWAKLEKSYAPLAGMHHRIVQGQADIGTVYRLQAVTQSDSAANALCSAMKAQGLACQVKR